MECKHVDERWIRGKREQVVWLCIPFRLCSLSCLASIEEVQLEQLSSLEMLCAVFFFSPSLCSHGRARGRSSQAPGVSRVLPCSPLASHLLTPGQPHPSKRDLLKLTDRSRGSVLQSFAAIFHFTSTSKVAADWWAQPIRRILVCFIGPKRFTDHCFSVLVIF